MCRPPAGHTGEVRHHPSDQLAGGVGGRGNGRRRLPELHHLHRDVFCSAGPSPRFHLQSLHGQESGLTRWEGRIVDTACCTNTCSILVSLSVSSTHSALTLLSCLSVFPRFCSSTFLLSHAPLFSAGPIKDLFPLMDTLVGSRVSSHALDSSLVLFLARTRCPVNAFCPSCSQHFCFCHL